MIKADGIAGNWYGATNLLSSPDFASFIIFLCKFTAYLVFANRWLNAI